MSISQRLGELKGSSLIRQPRLPRVSRAELTLNAVSARFENVGSISKSDFAALQSKLRFASQSRSLSDLTQRELRLCATCLFDSSIRLSEDTDLLDQLLGALRSTRSRIAVKRLIHTYCLHFEANNPAIRQIGLFLSDAVLNVGANRHWIWPELHRRFGIFDPTQVVDRLAAITKASTQPRVDLQRLGLGNQIMTSGLCAHVFGRNLEQVQQRLMTEADQRDIDHVIAWSEAEDGTLYFSAYRGPIANALLLPWANRTPSAEIRQSIQTFLLKQLNDPRINSGAWLGADELAKDIMIRWLAQATLEQFLKVVDRVAATHQWEYRRAFWNAYIEKKVVVNAWVAFGSSGALVARRIAASTSDSLMSRFATLNGSSADQAVLLLQIDDLIIADWSHNGRLRIWRRGGRNVPALYKDSYFASELRSDSDFDTVHIPADGWQSRAEAYIRRNTGVRLLESEYMPRSRRS